MPSRYTQEDLIEQFYETIKEKYPNLSKKQIEDMCKSIFHFVVDGMSRRDMPTIHIKYLGKFRVFASKVQNKIIENRLRFEELGVISEKAFKERDRELRARLIRILLNEGNNEPYSEDKED